MSIVPGYMMLFSAFPRLGLLHQHLSCCGGYVYAAKENLSRSSALFLCFCKLFCPGLHCSAQHRSWMDVSFSERGERRQP